MSEGGLITAGQLGVFSRLERAAPSRRPREVPTSPVPSDSPLADVEKRLVLDALGNAKGNKSKAAKLLGITRSQLYTRMKRFGLEG